MAHILDPETHINSGVFLVKRDFVPEVGKNQLNKYDTPNDKLINSYQF